MSLPTYGQPIVNADPLDRTDPQSFNDNVKFFFGDDDDSSISYDGADLVINPKEFGGGSLKVEGDLDVGGDIFVRNGFGVVIGHNTQLTHTNTPEFQLLGTAAADSTALIGRWQANATAPALDFVKSRNATIGLNTIVQDDDIIGRIRWLPDDGVDFATVAARFCVLVDDPTPAAGDIGMKFIWEQMPGAGGAIRETMCLTADGTLFFADAGGVVIGHDAQITAFNTSEFQVLGTGGVDSSVIIARFSANASSGAINLLKSRNPAIGSNTIVQDNDIVGQIKFLPDDGVDFNTNAAQFRAEVDDPSPAVDDIGMAFVWSQMPGGGGALRETMRLGADGNLNLVVGSLDLNSQGSILDVGGAGNDWTGNQLIHSGSGLTTFERTVVTTSGVVGVFAMKLLTSGNMADGFGPVLSFLVTDDSVTNITLGDVGFRRAGADNTGDFVLATRVAGVFNEAFKVTSLGLGSFDLAGDGTGLPSSHDAHDDAMVLYKGISLGMLEELENIGVIERKNTGSGWFLNLQPFLYLLAGSTYQNRQRIDDHYDEFNSRLTALGV